MLNRNVIVDKLIDEHSCSFSEEFADFLFSEIEISYLFQDLSTYFFLKEEVKKCEPYDGFSAEDQLEYYINSNGFNPIEKLQEQTVKLVNILSSYIDFSPIHNLSHFDMKQYISDCENFNVNLSSLNLPYPKLIENFYCDYYISKKGSL